VRLVAVHARTMTLELARQPSYVVPTLLFPAVFFLFFGAPAAAGGAEARLATFAGFAVIGVAFFQFGVGIAAERASPWEAYVRTLPVGACARLVARILSAGAFAAVAAGAVVATAVATTSASLAASSWLELAAALGAGGVPFAALGVAIGYWAPPRGALPIANLLYLALSYAGGLWLRPESLPHLVERISPVLPTRALADVLVASAAGAPVPWPACGALAGFTAVFTTCALCGYRRDEGRRYR